MLYFLTTKRFSLLAPFGIVCSVGEKKKNKSDKIKPNFTDPSPAEFLGTGEGLDQLKQCVSISAAEMSCLQSFFFC